MVRGRAILSTVICGAALVIGAFLLLGGGGGSPRIVRAEFDDAFPLVPNADVRTFGAKVGSVGKMSLTDRGTVSVEIKLLDGVRRPRSDASASVRAGDLLGSTYLALSPGRSARPLEDAIPRRRSFVATSVQDTLNSYDEPTRKALGLLIGELGMTLEGRGADLNRAVLELAPALRASTRLTKQVSDQRAHLQGLISSARRVTRQVAPRTRDLERLITGLDETFGATAANAGAIDRGLQALPASLAQTRTTLAGLESTATAAQPLARQLGASAPGLLKATRNLEPFADAASGAVTDLRPLVRQTRATLVAGKSTFPRTAASLQAIRTASPDLVRFGEVFDPLINIAIKGTFGGLGGLAGEPGKQLAENVLGRNWFRTIGVLGCESFGVPPAPGCMTQILQQTARERAQPGARRRAASDRAGSRPLTGQTTGNPGTPGTPSPPRDDKRPSRLPALPSLPGLSAVPGATSKVDDSTAKLLDFLLGP